MPGGLGVSITGCVAIVTARLCAVAVAAYVSFWQRGSQDVLRGLIRHRYQLTPGSADVEVKVKVV